MHRNVAAVCLLGLLAATSGQGRIRIDLAGTWERWIGDQRYDSMVVPSSYRPIGVAVLRRRLELMRPLQAEQRAVLRFEGIAHQGIARINGQVVGVMGPWTRHEFDVTDKLRSGSNQLEVEIADWQVPLGPIGAWEAYGGIIRDVFLEIRSDPYIENAHLRCAVKPEADLARCALDVYMKAAAPLGGKLSAELLRGATPVAQVSREIPLKPGASTTTLQWDLKSPVLWSPEVPNLYTLRIRLNSVRGQDVFSAETGIRDLKIRGNQFLLNGQPVVLRGVCRHDLWKDQGHTMSQAQIEQDLRMIKAMGANFVRLVHYPHDVRVVETAARLGLLVTEESGLVWVDFRKLSRETIETGLQNLERTIRRDWNSPSLFAVLLANESAPTVEVIREARQRVRALAPELFLSSARIDSPEQNYEGSRRLFDEGGLDFYTDHKYGYDLRMFEQSAQAYAGKPLVFTEWGGRAIGQSPILMSETTKRIARLVESGRLAGHSFWSWADLPEFSRQDAEMEGGILKSGVATEARVVRPDVFVALSELFRVSPGMREAPSLAPQVLAPRTVPLSAASEFIPISLQPTVEAAERAGVWRELERLMERYWAAHSFTRRHWEQSGGRFWLWDAPRLQIGLVPFETPVWQEKTRPLVVTAQHQRAEIRVALEADRLHFLGNVTVPDGYPVIGRFGDRFARYVIEYAGGECQEVPLRWGREIARSNMIAVASRIDPATSRGERVLRYLKEPTREVYQARLLSVDTRRKRIVRVVVELDPRSPDGAAPPPDTHHSLEQNLSVREQALLLFGITAERR
jgi:hypothetical protein